MRATTVTSLPGKIRSQSSAVSLEELILLPAPPQFRDFNPHLEDLRQACHRGDLFQATTAWGRLKDCYSVDQAETQDMEAVSKVLTDSFTGRRPKSDIAIIAKYHPERSGWLVEMAVNAAAKDFWHGLYRLMLALLAAGRPTDASAAFERYKDAKRTLQGIDKEDLGSWDRVARLAARIEGEGSKPLIMIQIAALTMTDQLDTINVLALFDVKTDFRRINVDIMSDVRAVVSRSWPKDFINKFVASHRIVMLGLMCYHSTALRERIKALASTGRQEELFQLYGEILSATIGADRLIRPRNLDELSIAPGLVESNVIALRPQIWS